MKVVIYGSVLYQSALTAYPGAWNEFSINPFVNPLHFGTAFWMITFWMLDIPKKGVFSCAVDAWHQCIANLDHPIILVLHNISFCIKKFQCKQ